MNEKLEKASERFGKARKNLNKILLKEVNTGEEISKDIPNGEKNEIIKEWKEAEKEFYSLFWEDKGAPQNQILDMLKQVGLI